MMNMVPSSSSSGPKNLFFDTLYEAFFYIFRARSRHICGGMYTQTTAESSRRVFQAKDTLSFQVANGCVQTRADMGW